VVKIRLQRIGRKKLPVYRIVAADSRAPRDGRFIEALGQYAPLSNPVRIDINAERALYWLSVGAQPTDTARSLLGKRGIMLHFHLLKKGKSEEDIRSELEKWAAERASSRSSELSKKQRRTIRKKEAQAAEKPVEEAQPSQETPETE